MRHDPASPASPSSIAQRSRAGAPPPPRRPPRAGSKKTEWKSPASSRTCSIWKRATRALAVGPPAAAAAAAAAAARSSRLADAAAAAIAGGALAQAWQAARARDDVRVPARDERVAVGAAGAAVVEARGAEPVGGRAHRRVHLVAEAKQRLRARGRRGEAADRRGRVGLVERGVPRVERGVDRGDDLGARDGRVRRGRVRIGGVDAERRRRVAPRAHGRRAGRGAREPLEHAREQLGDARADEGVRVRRERKRAARPRALERGARHTAQQPTASSPPPASTAPSRTTLPAP